MAAKRSAPPHSRAAVVALPRRGRSRPWLPSRRSLAVGVGIAALAAVMYVAARESSVFAVRTVDVRGGPAPVRAEVEQALAPLRGTSLLALDGSALERRIDALPTVVSSTYDRAFPHTLRVTIVPEVPVAVLHHGTERWLVSARGRVIARIPPRTRELLPRIWLSPATAVVAGELLSPDAGGAAAHALALATRFPARIATATFVDGELAFQLRSRIELRLGEPIEIRLKLAIAGSALPRLPAGSAYLDVSVPERPVAGANPQVSSGG